MNKNALSVSIVLPNWNGAHLLEKNLPAIISAAGSVEIIVADDASSDGSVRLLKEKFPEVVVVENNVRQGFAGNVNSGVMRAQGDIVVLLNTDVRPEKGFLGSLLKHFEDDRVFAVGCLDKSHENGKIVLRGRGIARWEKGYFIHERGEVDKTDTAWVSGGSGAFRKIMWDELGGMDTLYNPFYWEDIDISYRALKAGYRLVFEPKSIVHHFHEQGKIKSDFSPKDVKRIAYRNQFIFIWKNLSDYSIACEHCIWTPIRLLQAVFGRDQLMIQGYIAALRMLPNVVGTRSRSSRYWRIPDRKVSLS
ncbi:glycosyltransferase family 2 protein [Patescibacteria group bacterium]|nr:glycosyltransferase family 2 protein [Patescibacteria group bacterium]MBU1472753.1 glycosyltransferase family 2 protein [Patescibacteria group bacterium]MBU2460019.1 glycosyltransferase family 2 protein [Patescibacteria group bacterium]MBU2544323.1 glycosyltransferase family 2 protein [Patescibacteria group bacterium]